MAQTERITNTSTFGDALFEILNRRLTKKKTFKLTAKIADDIIDSTFTRFPSGPNMYEV